MKTFHLLRIQDDSGVSGIGVVAEGVQFQNGHCVISWLTQFDSLGVYKDVETLENIHGHGGHTQVVFDVEVICANL
jgi:hypothetical protein